jgi:hypothetical protein
MSERRDPACRLAEHRSSDWTLGHDRTWQCGICQPPSRGLVKAGLVVRRSEVNRGVDGDVGDSAPASLADLTPVETDRLYELERVVARGLQTFVEVGQALAAIRDQRLYRAGHATFEDYCRERWGFGRTRAHRLIEAADLAAMLPMGNKPANERQARELAPLKDDPEQVRAVWTEAVAEHGPKPTAKQVRAKVTKASTRGEERHDQDPAWKRKQRAWRVFGQISALTQTARNERDALVLAIETTKEQNALVAAMTATRCARRALDEIVAAIDPQLTDEDRKQVETFLVATGLTNDEARSTGHEEVR